VKMEKDVACLDKFILQISGKENTITEEFQNILNHN
jgi:hypothetical protein